MRFAHTNIVARDWKSLVDFYIVVYFKKFLLKDWKK